MADPESGPVWASINLSDFWNPQCDTPHTVSSYFPLNLPNLNTGADNIGLETNSVVAEQKIFHTSTYQSHVVLPVIPRR